jgi:hypothetical protein
LFPFFKAKPPQLLQIGWVPLVSRNLCHTTDSQLDWGLGFD